MRKDADVVKRVEEVEYEMTGKDEGIYRIHYAYTIMNEKGEWKAPLIVGCDKLRKVVSIEGALYNGMGMLVRRLKNKEIIDMSDIEEINLFDDNRRKAHDFNYHSFPYTVEYWYEVKISNTYMIPNWIPQTAERQSVESASFRFIAPAEYKVRYQAFNYKDVPEVSDVKNKRTTTWKVTGLPAVKRPFAAPIWEELTTCVYFAPSSFEFAGFEGDASTWQGLGRFALSLNEGRDQLPDNVIQQIRQLTAGITDDREKVAVLYRYLQKNTRYISIQRGIGGLQPFEASFVAEKGYGDCKALSNYMYSILKAAGIPSYYALVHAGTDLDDKYLAEDFPADRFNHIIVCVPLKGDSLWLECTDQDLPAGYMSGFTANRKALLITPEGGKLAATPRYGLNENRQHRVIQAKVEQDGTMQMKSQTSYGGIQQDHWTGMINHLSRDKVLEYLQEALSLSTYNVNDFSYEQTRASLPGLKENLDITLNSYATISGKRIFITPNILNREGRQPEMEEGRKVDYVFNNAWMDEDDCEIEVPEGYEVEAMPQPITIRTSFGSYSSSVTFKNNRIIYHREQVQQSGRFPASVQEELVKYFSDVYKADRTRVVLKKIGG